MVNMGAIIATCVNCRIIQQYIMRDEAGALVPVSSDINKVGDFWQLNGLQYLVEIKGMKQPTASKSDTNQQTSL